MTEAGPGSHETIGHRLWRWLRRTPVVTFILCPLAVIAFELALHGGRLTIVPWGVPFLAWGYLQYLLVGGYRHPRACGTAWMEGPPQRISYFVTYRFTCSPMYIGHLICLPGLAITFWSWFALIVLAARAVWFHRRVLHDEARLEKVFGGEYTSYRSRVKRWIPGVW